MKESKIPVNRRCFLPARSSDPDKKDLRYFSLTNTLYHEDPKTGQIRNLGKRRNKWDRRAEKKQQKV